MFEIGKEIYRLFKDSGVTKVFTIEASGIAIALAAAYQFKVPAVLQRRASQTILRMRYIRFRLSLLPGTRSMRFR